MTTRPHSVRMKHERVQRGSLFSGVAAAAWLVSGVALVALTQSWWSWLFVGVGVAVSCVFFLFLPRLRRAKQQLAHVEQLRVDQERAAQAQLAARLRAFSQPPVRTPFPSS